MLKSDLESPKQITRSVCSQVLYTYITALLILKFPIITSNSHIYVEKMFDLYIVHGSRALETQRYGTKIWLHNFYPLSLRFGSKIIFITSVHSLGITQIFFAKHTLDRMKSYQINSVPTELEVIKLYCINNDEIFIFGCISQITLCIGEKFELEWLPVPKYYEI